MRKLNARGDKNNDQHTLYVHFKNTEFVYLAKLVLFLYIISLFELWRELGIHRLCTRTISIVTRCIKYVHICYVHMYDVGMKGCITLS